MRNLKQAEIPGRIFSLAEALAELTPVRWDVVNAPGVRLARGEPHSPNIPGGSSASSENVNSADEKRPQ
ncbi:hypothetical protein ROHU_008591 [Labeo rohita]|uniref:Uncharacterized protein n=1 Tax=Labeo rohita TaxID=84645 RepID=A0A498M5T7_LABRO|nr:hypothetical protein ROHU_008591 [Labeo rohita]